MAMALPVKREDRTPAERGWDPLAQFQDVYTQMGRLFRDMGVLSLRAPKVETAKPRRVEVAGE
jgi:hypothetical protein